ncbi:MAG: hypothetical protein KDG55_22290, partial [Rhodocyclaceae bacterium]|nr:hypothetical protein [Rhodocyclaceae bacterium]
LAAGRAAEAATLLEGQPASDALLLRQAIAARASGATRAAALARELDARLAAAAERGDGGATHLREQALKALRLDDDPGAALDLARRNLIQQREPDDLLLFARAARAMDDRQALAELRSLMDTMGVRDARMRP